MKNRMDIISQNPSKISSLENLEKPWGKKYKPVYIRIFVLFMKTVPRR
jgi:hypothetical protein